MAVARERGRGSRGRGASCCRCSAPQPRPSVTASVLPPREKLSPALESWSLSLPRVGSGKLAARAAAHPHSTEGKKKGNKEEGRVRHELSAWFGSRSRGRWAAPLPPAPPEPGLRSPKPSPTAHSAQRGSARVLAENLKHSFLIFSI